MKCKNCPMMYTPYEGEYNSNPTCYLFGEEDSPFLYEDSNGEEGCYIDRHYIDKVVKEWKGR